MKKICTTCIHHCCLEPGQRGLCGARENKDGSIICSNYGMVTALALDPVEKKPLKMFHPGSYILSAGSYGCNLKCPFCQNYEISMLKEPGLLATHNTIYISPEELAGKAAEYKNAGNIGIAFTYNEPLVGWEYVRDTARLVKKAGMKNVLVTNGTASQEVLAELLPYIDAMNIDLKGFQEEYYQKLGGNLQPVKEFITCAAHECHVELTTLIVPGENDSAAQIEEEAEWIASLQDKTGRTIPLHITRFFPRYHMEDKEATDIKLVYHLADVARAYLENVFTGNC